MNKILEQIVEVSGYLSHAIYMEEWQQVKSWGKQLEILVDIYKNGKDK